MTRSPQKVGNRTKRHILCCE